MTMKYIKNAGETQIKYQPKLHTILIRYDYKDYFISASSPTTCECGFRVYSNDKTIGTYYYAEKGYPNVGDMYNLGYKAIDSILPSDVLSSLTVDLSSELCAFLFGQSAMLVRLYRLTKEREDG